MDRILDKRRLIHDQFRNSSIRTSYFLLRENVDVFAAYDTSMSLIQDTGEAVFAHIRRGFSANPWTAYIEFWGVMQAVAIQQDAILELYEAVVGCTTRIEEDSAWQELRKTRHLCVGHPANQRHGRSAPRRTYMARGFGSYDSIGYVMWDAQTAKTSFPNFGLGQMIKRYDLEASEVLQEVLSCMRSRWP